MIIGKGNNTLKDMSKLADAVQAKINTLGESIMTVEKKTGELSDMFVDIKPATGSCDHAVCRSTANGPQLT